jgi:predicted Fe-Mo cluster-binding NifX family protein
MATRKIAIPASEPKLEAQIDGHFGHTQFFTVVEYDAETKSILKVEAVENPPHEQGGCFRPVMLLKNHGIDTIVVLGIGQRPFMGFIENGIEVVRGIEGTVKQNFDAFVGGSLSVLAGSSCQH